MGRIPAGEDIDRPDMPTVQAGTDSVADPGMSGAAAVPPDMPAGADKGVCHKVAEALRGTPVGVPGQVVQQDTPVEVGLADPVQGDIPAVGRPAGLQEAGPVQKAP